MDELPAPPGSPEPLALSDAERALAIYGATNPDWADRVTAAQFLYADPALAARLRTPREFPPRHFGEWLARRALPLALAGLIIVLLVSRDWKIEHLFSTPSAGSDPARTVLIRPLTQSAPPSASATHIRAINSALTESPLNWQTVLEQSTRLRADAEALAAVRADAKTNAWLHEVLASAHMHLAERAGHRAGHYEAIVELDRDFGPRELRRPFIVAYSGCVARFELAGGSRDLFIGQPTAIPAEELLAAVAALRNSFPAELVKSPEQQRQLARVEGYSLLRQIAPRKVRWFSYAPFDENDPANRETWTQLALAMAQWKTLEGDRPSGDLDQLQRVFWQAIEGFCKWPTRWKDDFVTIGNRDYRRAEAQAALAELATRQRTP